MPETFYQRQARKKGRLARRLEQIPFKGDTIIDFSNALRRHDQRCAAQPWQVLEQENVGLDALSRSIRSAMSYQDKRDYDCLCEHLRPSRCLSVDGYEHVLPQKREILSRYCSRNQLTYTHLRSLAELSQQEGTHSYV